ncbi:BRICHOS domain-containing protein 5 isoform X2 [Athene cunicularia]|nr:BRICHOS domain-containing protein 5 isoform X1 [Athene cunicularia]XP_026715133.1 BRICHOS domain-containing protein 5 isoform X2 [Athene cunicularia]
MAPASSEGRHKAPDCHPPAGWLRRTRFPGRARSRGSCPVCVLAQGRAAGARSSSEGKDGGWERRWCCPPCSEYPWFPPCCHRVPALLLLSSSSEGAELLPLLWIPGRRAAGHLPSPSRTFWIVLSVAVFFTVVGIGVMGVLSFSPSSAQAGSQLVRLTLQGQQDPLRNQTALVDKSRSTVTYFVTSQSNHTAVVLYDSRNGYVCYKPMEQRACYLRRMDHWDLQTLQTSLNTSEQRAEELLRQNNQTKYYREFMGILAGEQVDPKSLGEAVQALCEQTSIFWVRRGEGPGKQRLIYLCIDICFPSNICVSICFYYLPE